VSAKPQAVARGFVLIAVLVIMAGAIFITTTLLYTAQAELAGSAGAIDAGHSRALARSGLEIITQRLNEHRDVILRGEMPQLEDEYIVYENATHLGVVRLSPIKPQAARLDVNDIDAESLIATGQVEPDVAEAIIAHRAARGGAIQSIAELRELPQITAEMLSGMDTTARNSELGTRNFSDLLTVHAVEPNLQRSGRLRINLNTPWSDELGGRLDERFGEGAAAVVKEIMDSGTTFESDERIVAVLRLFQSPHEDWADILDALTTSDGEYLFGRIDINTAPPEVMLALPGLTPEQAEQIVQARETLDSDERETITWPLLRGIVDGEAFGRIVDRITVRSWTFGIRMEAGEVEADDPQGRLRNPLVYDAVIDLSAPRPRIAYLRDATMLEIAAILAMDGGGNDDEGGRYEDAWDRGGTDPEVPIQVEDENDLRPDDNDDGMAGQPDLDDVPVRRRIGRWRGG
jgi:DNA uptake protein ComE-like DNA-binding protein